jgi:hypothetical protein
MYSVCDARKNSRTSWYGWARNGIVGTALSAESTNWMITMPDIDWDTYNTVMKDRYNDGLREARAVAKGIIEKLCLQLDVKSKPYVEELYGRQTN